MPWEIFHADMTEIQEKYDDTPLPVLFAEVARSCNDLSSISTSARNDLLDRLVVCSRQIDKHALFSRNEELDDVATSYLKYLLVPFFLAEVLATSPERAPAARSQELRSAISAYREFLGKCECYNLLSGLPGADGIAQGDESRLDPHTRRTLKIERFKQEKSVSSRIKQLESDQERAARCEQEGEVSRGQDQFDEEQERELWVLRIKHAALRSLGQKDLIQDEVQLVDHALASTAESSGRPIEPQSGSQEQQEATMRQLLDITSQLQIGERERMKQQVFRPSHILPTVSLEEYARMEMEDVKRREAAQERRTAAEEEESDEDDEERLMKQRQWDDFKDDHPFGSGNSKLRPCA